MNDIDEYRQGELLVEAFVAKQRLKNSLNKIRNSITTYMRTLDSKATFDKCSYDNETFIDYFKNNKDYLYFSANGRIKDPKQWRERWKSYVDEFNTHTDALVRAINKKFKGKVPEIKEIKALKTTGNIKVEFAKKEN